MSHPNLILSPVTGLPNLRFPLVLTGMYWDGSAYRVHSCLFP